MLTKSVMNSRMGRHQMAFLGDVSPRSTARRRMVYSTYDMMPARSGEMNQLITITTTPVQQASGRREASRVSVFKIGRVVCRHLLG